MFNSCCIYGLLKFTNKWPEAFAIPDQKAETIAKLFVEQIVCRHGIPEELLSDHGISCPP